MKIKGIPLMLLAVALMFVAAASTASACIEESAADILTFVEGSSVLSQEEIGDSGVIMTQVKVPVGEGTYDSITITNYLKEGVEVDSEAIVLFTGQSLTHKFYEDLCVNLAQQGKNVYVIDRREANVPITEENLSFMQDWGVDQTLDDYSLGVKLIRLHTAFLSHEHVYNVEIVGIGHSLGATLMMSYDDGSVLGKLDKRVIVDTIIAYDPAETDLIAGQTAYCQEVLNSINNGTYYADNMKDMIGLGALALQYPDVICPLQPVPGFSLTNEQVFRVMAGMTYAGMDHPYTPTYHYWTIDPTLMWYAPLPYVNETLLLQNVVVEGGAVAYSPSLIDLYASQLMVGQETIPQANFANAEYIGLEGGFGSYGEYSFTQAGCPTQVIGSVGHGSIFSSQEVWDAIATSVN